MSELTFALSCQAVTHTPPRSGTHLSSARSAPFVNSGDFCLVQGAISKREICSQVCLCCQFWRRDCRMIAGQDAQTFIMGFQPLQVSVCYPEYLSLKSPAQQSLQFQQTPLRLSDNVGHFVSNHFRQGAFIGWIWIKLCGMTPGSLNECHELCPFCM